MIGSIADDPHQSDIINKESRRLKGIRRQPRRRRRRKSEYDRRVMAWRWAVSCGWNEANFPFAFA